MADHKKKSLKIQNSLRALDEALENSFAELIRDYGKETSDPNVYEIEIPAKDVFYLPETGWIGGKITLDVSYYCGVITLNVYKYSDLKDEDVTIKFDSIDNIRYRLHLYRLMANHYEKNRRNVW